MKKALSLILVLSLVVVTLVIPVSAAEEQTVYAAHEVFEEKNGSASWSFQSAVPGRNDYKNLEFIETGWFNEYYQNWVMGCWMHCAATIKEVGGHAGEAGDPTLTFEAPRDGNIQISTFNIRHKDDAGDGVQFQLLKNDMVIFPEDVDWYVPENLQDFDIKVPNIYLTVKKGDKIHLRVNMIETQQCDAFYVTNYQMKYLSAEAYEKGTTRAGAVVVNKTPIVEEKIVVNFTDVNNHWGKDYIIPLAEKGIIKGKSATTFEPDSNITRAEFLTLALNVGGITAAAGETYPDVATDAWFSNTVATAKSMGLIDVNMTADGNFYPDKNITREEMTTVIVKLYESQKEPAPAGDVAGFSDNASFSAWTRDSIGKAVALGVVTGNPDGTFNALGNATRAEAAVIFSRLLKLL